MAETGLIYHTETGSHGVRGVLEMIAKVPTTKAHNIWLTSGNETRRKAAIEFVTKGLQTGALKPVIDRTFTFERWRMCTAISSRTVSSGRS
jgi:NADPH:quinone reductase-like Zn-dependent oxidoreductase